MKRILYGSLSHETNSFSPIRGDMEAFKSRFLLFGEEIRPTFEGAEDQLSGFIETVESRSDVETVPSIRFSASPSAPVTKEVYDLALSEVLKVYKEKGPFDGIYLALHGAMVAEGHPDGEGDFIESIRKVCGKDIPIIVTLDLHANITEKMAAFADVLIPCKYYPHTDFYPAAILAGKMMLGLFDGSFKPAMAFRHIPYLLPLFPTEFEPMKSLVEKAQAMEECGRVWSARVAHGFFHANIPQMGMSVVVVTNGDKEGAEKAADELTEAVYAAKPQLVRSYPTLDEALDIAEKNEGAPVVIADSSDNTGAGGTGDTTHILRRVLERGMSGGIFSVMFDKETVRKCIEAGIGAEVDIWAGGGYDPRLTGGPVELKGKVIRLTDGRFRNQDEMDRGMQANFGLMAVIEVAGNYVIVSSNRCQPYDAEVMRSCGIMPERAKFIVVKSSVHYRASYGRFSSEMIEVAVPGYCAPEPGIFRNLGFPLEDAE